jgi:4,5-dihydroxyphthalate decarboxylase
VNEAAEHRSGGKPRRLKVGMSINDRMLPILTGQVTAPSIELQFESATPSALFWRALHEGAFDVTEMSLAAHAILKSRGENPFVGLPVFTSRMFRHGSIFVSSTSGIMTPQDLAGRRVGIPEYQMTAAVWLRGILQEFYGVKPAQISWVTGGVNKTGRKERIKLDLPSDVRVEAIDDTATLSDMLLANKIDAIMAPQVPDAFRHGDDRVRRLFSDSRQVEEAYFAETGIFPIMHLAVVRRELLAAEPELLAPLFHLFDDARRMALSTLTDADAPYVMLPWQVAAAEQTRTLMGDDYWPYGIEPNRQVLATFIRYLDEQGLLAKPIDVEDLFAGNPSDCWALPASATAPG